MRGRLISVVALVIASGPALAASPSGWKTYIGGGYQGVALQTGSLTGGIPTKLSSGAELHIGERFNRYFAVELGYMQADASKSFTAASPTYRTKMTASGVSLDLKGYLPLVANFSLMGTVGGTYLTSHALSNQTTNLIDASKSEMTYRAGAGVEWRPVPGFGLELAGRYQMAKFGGYAKNGLVYGLSGSLFF